jgi:hypothetical protein
MIKKVHLALYLVLLGLAFSACQQELKPSASAKTTEATAEASDKEDPAAIKEVKRTLRPCSQLSRSTRGR